MTCFFCFCQLIIQINYKYFISSNYRVVIHILQSKFSDGLLVECYQTGRNGDTLSINKRRTVWWLICAMSYKRVFGAKTRQMLTFSGFRKATFRPATRKYATFHALRFRLLFVVSLPGEANGRMCENPTKSPFGGFSRGDLSRFRPENTFIRHGINQPP